MKNIQEQLEQLREQASHNQAAPTQNTSTLNFVTPTEIVELPSKGLFYPEDHPLHNKDSVEIKQMTAREEDILTNKSFIRKGLVIDKLVESLLVDKTINVNSLLVGDKNAIMVAARINAYGPSYDVVVNCLECGAKNMLGIDLLEITTRDTEKIDAAKAENPLLAHERLENGNVVITLPKTGWMATCKLLTGRDEKEVLSLLEGKKKLYGADAEVAISEQLYFILTSVNDVFDRETLKQVIGLMPAYDAKHLRNVYAKLIPNVAIEKKYTCSSCNGEQEMEVPFTQEFFWPK